MESIKTNRGLLCCVFGSLSVPHQELDCSKDKEDRVAVLLLGYLRRVCGARLLLHNWQHAWHISSAAAGQNAAVWQQCVAY